MANLVHPSPPNPFEATPVSIPHRERKWIDVEPGKFSQGCLEVSKFMISVLRHDDTVHREEDGHVRFDDLAEKLKARFAGTSQWSIEAWVTFLAKGRGPKKSFQSCLNPNSSKHFMYFSEQPRDIREVFSLILHCKTMHCCQMTSPSTSATSGTLTTCTPSSRAD